MMYGIPISKIQSFSLSILWIVAMVMPNECSAQGNSRYKLALPPYEYQFPRDHASHPDYRTEWWYYTGHLKSDNRTFGYELTFFRVGINPTRRSGGSAWALHTLFFAHFAVTDEAGEKFYHSEAIGRPALKMAGSLEDRYKVWIGKWSAELLGDDATHRLTAQGPETAISLDLLPAKPPVVHGNEGVSQKSEGAGRASHYYSLTRLKTSGTLTVKGNSYAVTGLSWMDHEFGTNQLTLQQQGWDWFSIQLDNNRELMLYMLRLKDGTLEPASSGTVVAADGTWKHLDLSMYTIESTGTWTSPHNGATYPSGWKISVPNEGAELRIIPTIEDQELVSRSILGITYWEGRVLVEGFDQGKPVSGMGYVELTGYIGKVPGF